MKKLSFLFVTAIAATLLASCANAPGGSSVAPTSATSGTEASSTSETPVKSAWTAEELELINDYSFIEFPFFNEGEVSVEDEILYIDGGNASSSDIEDYCASLEEFDQVTFKDSGVKYRYTVAAEDISEDFAYYFELEDQVQYRINIEYYDSDYSEWGQAYTVNQVLNVGTYEDKFILISSISLNMMNAVFGVNADGMSLYYPSIYQYLIDEEYGIGAMAGYAVGFDGEYVYPEFDRDEKSEEDLVYVVEYSYVLPLLYGDTFLFEVGLAGGTEEERTDYIAALETAGYVAQEREAEDTSDFYYKATETGYATIEVSDYEEEFVELQSSEVFAGYSVAFGFEVEEAEAE